MKKKFLRILASVFLCFAILCVSFTEVEAITTSEVTPKLNSLIHQYANRNWSQSFAGGTQ